MNSSKSYFSDFAAWARDNGYETEFNYSSADHGISRVTASNKYVSFEIIAIDKYWEGRVRTLVISATRRDDNAVFSETVTLQKFPKIEAVVPCIIKKLKPALERLKDRPLVSDDFRNVEYSDVVDNQCL